MYPTTDEPPRRSRLHRRLPRRADSRGVDPNTVRGSSTRAGLAFGHGTDNAIDDAAALVFHVLGLRARRTPPTHTQRPSAPPTSSTRARCSRERIERRVPAAYLMGRMWFAGLEFEVDTARDRAAVAVRRVDRSAASSRGSIRRACDESLDIGTGSGCIAIACALRFPEAHVDAVDMSADGARGRRAQRRAARRAGSRAVASAATCSSRWARASTT